MTSQAAPPPFPFLALSVLSTGFFVLGVAALSVIALSEAMAAGLEVSVAEIALLVTVYALTYALAAPGLQVVFKGLSPKRLIVSGLLVMTAGAALAALAPGYGLVLVGRVVMALGAGLVGPLSLATGGTMVPPSQQGRALATVFSGMTLATVVGLPALAWLGLLVGWREATGLIGLAALLAAGLVWRLVPEPKSWQAASLALLISALRQPKITWAVLVTFLQMSGQFATYAVIAAFLAERYATDVSLLPLALLLFGVGGIVGNAIGGWAADRMRVETLLLSNLAVNGAIFLALALAPGSPLIGLALTFAWAVTGMMFQSPQQKRLVSLAPASSGLVLALHASALYVGMSFGALLAGWAATEFGYDLLPYLSLLITVAAMGASLLATRARRLSEA
ncbi:MAG: MFS transporter [Pseudomonadota bacterium]